MFLPMNKGRYKLAGMEASPLRIWLLPMLNTSPLWIVAMNKNTFPFTRPRTKRLPEATAGI